MKNVSTIVLGATLLSAVACGNNSGNSSSPQSNSLLLEAGHYEAKLAPLNAHLSGDVSATALVKVKGDEFTVEMKVNGSGSQMIHAQSIHLLDSCPTLSSDTNKDGVIDAVEGQQSYGSVLIPLDGNLNQQIEKEQRFPQSDFSGNYYYRQTASMLEMMTDLLGTDQDPQDNVVKLKSRLDLIGRQVVIYGISSDTALPETVGTIHGEAKHSSLPIACGPLIKIAVTEEGSNTDGGKH